MLDGKASTNSIRQDLGMYLVEPVSPVLTQFVVTLHEVLNDMNKMKRLLHLPYLFFVETDSIL